MLTSITAQENNINIGHRSCRINSSGLVAGVLFTPALLFYTGLASSFAVGLVVIACYILLKKSRPVASTYGSLPIITSARITRTTVIIVASVVIHLLMSIALHKVDVTRALVSLVILTIALFAAAKMANTLLYSAFDSLHRGLLKLFVAFCFIGLCGILLTMLNLGGPPTLATEAWRRPVFPFSEPATFALAFLPILTYVCSSIHGTSRLLAVITGLVFSLLIQNLTLACGVALISIVIFRMRTLVFMLILLFFVVPLMDLTYIIERIDMSGESQNLSNLVYLQGWQMIVEAMQHTQYLGLGFQQLGFQGTEVDASIIIRSLKDGDDMNLQDGGFVFAKLAADFGVFGILAAIAYCTLAVRSLLALRSAAFRRTLLPPAMMLSQASILTFGLEMFVRGAGYFSGTALLFTSSLWVVLGCRKVGIVKSRAITTP